MLTLSHVTMSKACPRYFLSMLAKFPALESLTLRKVRGFYYPPETGDLAPITSLRTLRLEGNRMGHFIAPALARAFPNITELRYIATGTEIGRAHV